MALTRSVTLRGEVSGTVDLPDNGWELTGSMVGLDGLGIDGSTLNAYTGSATVSSGTVLEDLRITSPINVAAGNITIRRCMFEGATNDMVFAATLANPVTVEDCTFDGRATPASQSAYPFAFRSYGGALMTIRRVRIRGWGHGWWCDGPVLVEDSVYEEGTAYGNPATSGSHNEALTHRSTAVNTFNRCRLDCFGQGNLSAVVQVQGDGSAAGNLALDSCFLNSGDIYYALVADTHPGGSLVAGSIDVTNSRWPTLTSVGYSIESGWGAKGTWTGNYRYDASNPPTYAGPAVT